MSDRAVHIAATASLFKVVVATRGELDFSNALHGFITDFVPTPEQQRVLRDLHQPLPVNTLFSVQERTMLPVEQLISKQILHYVETYGLESPGLFNLEVSSGRIATLTFIHAVTEAELSRLVLNLAYANRPVSDATTLVEIINGYGIRYDINKVANNELRVAMFDPARDVFASGDDAVRWMCYKATNELSLIKSKEVIAKIKANPPENWFLYRHAKPLAQVFNRHKRLILAAKTPDSASIINKISKMSKIAHVPVHEPISKRFIAARLSQGADASIIQHVSLRDKFKYLNLIEYKLLQLPYDSFNIRNGRVWFEVDRKILDKGALTALRAEVLLSIREDLRHLEGKSILMDPSVDYGLPISRKQALGRLPFGTAVTGVLGKKLSAGIYWHNDFHPEFSSIRAWGGIDLDLSAIDSSGVRTGWGQYSGYDAEDIVFSGDLTDARDGASEFMTVDPKKPNKYGLMVNVFRGPDTCEAEIVVGHPNAKVWQEDTLIRERITLQSKQSLIGFLKGPNFIVYTGRLNSSRVSQGRHPVLDKGLVANLWTTRSLFNAVGIPYDLKVDVKKNYDYDLRYMTFTESVLEELFRV